MNVDGPTLPIVQTHQVWVYRHDGPCLVRVEVDVEQIARSMAQKAFTNKTRKAMDCGGYVRVYALEDAPK